MTTVTVSPKFQVVIPLAIRQALGLERHTAEGCRAEAIFIGAFPQLPWLARAPCSAHWPIRVGFEVSHSRTWIHSARVSPSSTRFNSSLLHQRRQLVAERSPAAKSDGNITS